MPCNYDMNKKKIFIHEKINPSAANNIYVQSYIKNNFKGNAVPKLLKLLFFQGVVFEVSVFDQPVGVLSIVF